MESLKLEKDIEDEEKVSLMSGSDFIIYPPDRMGNCKVLINCDKEMPVRLSFYDIKRSVNDLFGPEIKSAEFIDALQRGNILYTDKVVFKTLRPKDISMESPIPTAKQISKIFRNKPTLW